ncbi:ester cyclase [Pilimelia columellifera]|uniref:Ester cyclase n=1 Tax=Pilimelia columellifera subsp. columellifera TaxID=706583 RepID=A0ABN3NNK4_9ACTN
MGTEENKAVVMRAYLDGMNRKDMSVIRECFAPDYVNFFPAGQGQVRGIEDFTRTLGEFLDAFENLVFTVEDVFADGDKVVLRWSATGRHTGDYRGIPPTTVIPATRKEINFSATDIYRVVGGKIVEEWNTLDGWDIMYQMGAVKKLAPAAV